MKRDLLVQLLQWKKERRRKPLILQGARQVGKTHLLKELGENHYKDWIYLNFEEDTTLASFFTPRLSSSDILEKISIYSRKKIIPEETLILFDEVQACPAALNSLKYFCEEAPEIHIAAAGSLLGVELHGKGSFPVGKVNFLNLYPLSFYEFLDASGNSALREILEKELKPVPEAFHIRLCDLLRSYFFIGGMPEAVRVYQEEKDLTRVRQVQNEILKAYLLDFSKHAGKTDILKITRIWESIPVHLGRENKKFIFSAVSKSARAREYEHALQWLTDAGLIYKSFQIETPQIPLQSYQNNDSFKVFLLDIGLLGAMLKLQPETLLKGNELFSHTKGALTENYVAQELILFGESPLHYWVSQGTAEVDFLFSKILEGREVILPIEVKSGKSTKNKSLIEYGKRYAPRLMIRSGMSDLRKNEQFMHIPLYQIGSMKKLNFQD